MATMMTSQVAGRRRTTLRVQIRWSLAPFDRFARLGRRPMAPLRIAAGGMESRPQDDGIAAGGSAGRESSSKMESLVVAASYKTVVWSVVPKSSREGKFCKA